MKFFNIPFIFFSVLLANSISSFSQTITLLYINNDSIDVPKLQFINFETGLPLHTEVHGQLVHINEIFADTIKMIILFKNGSKIIVDTIETKFFSDCIINAMHNRNADSNCVLIAYSYGNRIIIRSSGNQYKKEINRVEMNSNPSYYHSITKNLKINMAKRIKLFYKLRKKDSPMK